MVCEQVALPLTYSVPTLRLLYHCIFTDPAGCSTLELVTVGSEGGTNNSETDSGKCQSSVTTTNSVICEDAAV